jgi:hypothetical protein
MMKVEEVLFDAPGHYPTIALAGELAPSVPPGWLGFTADSNLIHSIAKKTEMRMQSTAARFLSFLRP